MYASGFDINSSQSVYRGCSATRSFARSISIFVAWGFVSAERIAERSVGVTGITRKVNGWRRWGCACNADVWSSPLGRSGVYLQPGAVRHPLFDIGHSGRTLRTCRARRGGGSLRNQFNYGSTSIRPHQRPQTRRTSATVVAAAAAAQAGGFCYGYICSIFPSARVTRFAPDARGCVDTCTSTLFLS